MDGTRLAVLTAPLRRHRPQDGQHAAAHRPLRHPHIARDFSCVILHGAHDCSPPPRACPIHVLARPGHHGPHHGREPPQPEARRRLPAQFALSRLHPSADHSILIPIIDDDGIHRFTVLAKGHQADCGNALPTTYMGAAKDVYAEGALIFPAVRIQRITST
jgi:N-methylhydantoinase B